MVGCAHPHAPPQHDRSPGHSLLREIGRQEYFVHVLVKILNLQPIWGEESQTWRLQITPIQFAKDLPQPANRRAIISLPKVRDQKVRGQAVEEPRHPRSRACSEILPASDSGDDVIGLSKGRCQRLEGRS